MPEELAYARKASGLVRGLSFWDVLGIGLAFLTPIYAIWYVIGFSLSVYPRAQLVIAILISVATIVWASPIVWGVLGGTMPRSGGEYVYNSRIITPAVALGASFAAIMAQFYWNLFNASLLASPSLAMLGQYLGWSSFTNYVTSKAGATTISIVGFAIAFFIVAFGMKFFHRISLYVVGVIIGGVVIMNLMLTFSSHASLRAQLGRPGRQVPLGHLPRLRGRCRQSCGVAHAPHLELGRYLRRHRRRLHARHLGLRHRLRRR